MTCLFPAIAIVLVLVQYLRASFACSEPCRHARTCPRRSSLQGLNPLAASRPACVKGWRFPPAGQAQATDRDRLIAYRGLAAYRGSHRHRVAITRALGEELLPAGTQDLPPAEVSSCGVKVLRPPAFDAAGTLVGGLWRESSTAVLGMDSGMLAETRGKAATLYCAARRDGRVIILAALDGGREVSGQMQAGDRPADHVRTGGGRAMERRSAGERSDRTQAP